MSKYRLIYDGEVIEQVFDSEEAAEEYAAYLDGCSSVGAEILYMSNPGDYDYDENEDYTRDYDIEEIKD